MMWYYSQPEADPVNFDPYEGPFANIDHAFSSSAQSPRILIDEYKLPEDNCKAIAEALRNKKAILVSDGSYYKDNEAGGSAFILTPGKTNKNKIIGTNWSPGMKKDQNPYRSELVGINGGLSILGIIIKFFNIKEGGIEIVLDGESALNQAKEDFYQLKSSQSCFDILLDIRNHIKLLPKEFNIEWRWVESHQKEKKVKMDWYARQNNKVDRVAKKYVSKCIKKKRANCPVRLWYGNIALWIDGVKQSRVMNDKIYSRLQHDDIHSYWKNHHDFPIPHPHDIDWEPSRLATKRLSSGLQRWFVKFTTGFIGNQHMLHKRNQVSTPGCPHCGHSIEKSSHVLNCNNEKQKYILIKL